MVKEIAKDTVREMVERIGERRIKDRVKKILVEIIEID